MASEPPMQSIPETRKTMNASPEPYADPSQASRPAATRSVASVENGPIDNTKRPAPFSKRVTRSLFIKPKHLRGNAPGYAQSVRNLVTYSWLNVLLICNPIAWGLHYAGGDKVPAGATFAVALLGVVPLAGMLGFGTEALSLSTGDALGGLINASLGNATEFIIAILLLIKCDIRVVQSSLLGGLLSNLLLVLGMAFLVGGLRFSELEFQQTAAQLNTSLMTLAVIALIIPSAFAFALEAAVGEDKERDVILRMSRGSSIILIFIYISYMVFQLYSHKHYYNPGGGDNEEDEAEAAPAIADSAVQMKPAQNQAAPFDRPNFSPKMSSRPMPGRRTNSMPFYSKAGLGASGATHRAHHHPAKRGSGRNGSTDDTVAAEAGALPASGVRHRDFAAGRGRQSSIGARPVATRRDSSASSDGGIEDPELNLPVALIALVTVTGLTYLTAEALTVSLETIGESDNGPSPEWLGLILLAIVGNAAEHVTAVFVAYRNKVDLALAVSVGSCIQIALFVIPLLVLIGWVADKPLSLLFDPLETVTLFLSVLLVRFATEDGRTHYMSGVALLGTYLLIAFSFWFYPREGTSTSDLFNCK